MLYIIFGLLAVVMAAGAVCTVTRAGEKDGICKYDNMEDTQQ